MENYLCKEYFRLQSKKTGKGGYEKSADQIVVIPDAVLQETGRRNLMCRLMLNGEKQKPALEEISKVLMVAD